MVRTALMREREDGRVHAATACRMARAETGTLRNRNMRSSHQILGAPAMQRSS